MFRFKTRSRRNARPCRARPSFLALEPLEDRLLLSTIDYSTFFGGKGEDRGGSIAVDRDGYVYLFQVDSTGQFFQLFPMKSFKGIAVNQGNPVRAGHRYVLPAVDKSFKLDRTTGRERIYLVTSSSPHRELETLASRLDQARRQRDQAQVVALNRDLAAQLTGQSADADGQRLAYRGVEEIVDDEMVSVPWDDAQNPYNVLGQRIRTIYSRSRFGGLKPFSWDGLDEKGTMVPQGVYFIRIVAGDRSTVRKVVILR